MSNPSGPAHRNVANIRSPPSTNPGAPGSPHTPLRSISSTFGSPSALRAEEDCVVIELGARYLRAGFAGDAVPKAVLDFGPEEQRRAGDLRKWETDYDGSRLKNIHDKSWGDSYELWRPDLRGLELGLVGDKIERAIREAYTKYLLIDSRPRRMTLAIPSALPLPLVSTILDTLFINFQPPTISLLAAPVLTTVAAGLRSGLIVDIGWAETVVTAVYEYREVQCKRSVRAMKLLGGTFATILAEAINHTALEEDPTERKTAKESTLLSFQECEEVFSRMGWCKSAKKPEAELPAQGLPPVQEEDELGASMRSLNIGKGNKESAVVSIPLSSTAAPMTLRLSFSELAEPCESALFATGTAVEDLDDEELPLHLLIYRSLLYLPVDVRTICMARIVFVGGGSNILGVKRRILDELAILVETRGWDPVKGQAIEKLRSNPKLQRTRVRQTGPTEVQQDQGAATPGIPAGLVEQESDPIEEQLKREASKGAPPVVSGYLRAVESLGAFSGASLLSQLKIPSVSTVEREQWLQLGVSGASRPGEINIAAQRQSMGPSSFKSGAVDRSSWTLGLWG